VLYNAITFTDPHTATLRLFMDSLHLQPRLQNHTHDFVLRLPEDFKWATGIFKELSSFFLAYPRCTLKFFHPKLGSNKPSSLLFTALLVKYGARNDTTFLPKLTGDFELQQCILGALPIQLQTQFVTSLPGNIVIFPHDTFDEAVFRDSCKSHAVIRILLFTKTEGGLDELVAIAKDLYSHGF
jgi:hypothetical protein